MTRFYKNEEVNMLLGALFVQPSLFDNPKMESLSEADFPVKIHKIAYSIMSNLYSIGHSKFNQGIIAAYINGRPPLSEFFYQTMELESGEEVAQGEYYFDWLAESGEPTTFEPAFDIVKKMTLLRELEKNGVSVKQFYDWDAKDSKVETFQKNWLERTSLKDMANEISDSIADVIAKSSYGSQKESAQAGDGLLGLLESFKESPDYGSPSPIQMMDTITRGDRLGKFYLYSAPTGGGKSRIMMSRACYAAVDTVYDPKKREWVDNGVQEGSLFISTELDIEECQTMALSFITGIDEEIILDGKYDKSEEVILIQGARILAESPLYFEVIPDFSIQEIESTIRLYYREKDIKYFRFDYIHSSMKFLAEIASITNGMKLREDQVLFMLSTKLKDLATQLHIFIESGTQVNGNWQEEELNQNLLRGSKAIADRIDVGMIATKIRSIDEDAVDQFVASGYIRPNYIISFYKVRRGKYAGCKLWCNVDLGTCRCNGLFLTDSNNEPIGVDAKTIKVKKAAQKNLDKGTNKTLKSAF